MISVIEAVGNLNDFIKLPLVLHRADPFFVPQLNREMKLHFSRKNPFFEHAEARYFIALKDGRPAGRIASIIDRTHNRLHHEKTGFFGFFDCINDAAVAAALFERAAGDLRAAGITVMRGPVSFSTNDECGMLIEGFHERPMIMMPYNPPYYNELAEKAGLTKAKDLYAYIYDVRDKLPDKVLRVAAIVEKRGITVRPINMQQYLSDMLIFRDVYHSAWEKNWGFVPMTEDELAYAAGRLKQVIVPEMTLIAEEDGKPVGFMGMVPDINLVLKHMNGRMDPFSLAKALYYARKIKDLRVMLLGVKKEFRNKGVEALLFREGFKPIKKGNYQRVEFSWILEDNLPVQRTIETMDGRLYKKYRIYEKAL